MEALDNLTQKLQTTVVFCCSANRSISNDEHTLGIQTPAEEVFEPPNLSWESF